MHLADAEAAFADRIRRIIAEDDPVLLAWDENKFAERLMYAEQSAADAVALVRSPAGSWRGCCGNCRTPPSTAPAGTPSAAGRPWPTC